MLETAAQFKTMKASFLNFLLLGLVLSTGFVGLGKGTKVEKCLANHPEQMLNVELSDCESPPCILKKNTTLFVKIEFVPDYDVAKIKNVVNAKLGGGGIAMPFIGMDGTSACDYIYQEQGSIKTGCPLKAGTHYTYKNNIFIRPIYPSVSALVHWALLDTAKKENVACFETKVKITS